jgi:hypothetical protein
LIIAVKIWRNEKRRGVGKTALAAIEEDWRGYAD